MLKKLAKLSLAALGILSIAAPSFAVPYGTDNVYKWVLNGKTYVNIHGPAAGTSIAVVFSGVQRTAVKTADACGQVEVKPATGSTLSGNIVVGSRTIAFGSLSTQLKPSCVNGTLSEARATDYKTPEGYLVAVGFTASAPQNTITTGDRSRNITANACGARFTGTTSIPLSDSTQFTYSGTTYTVSALPTAPVGPRSLTTGGTPNCFKPVGVGNWGS